MEILRENGELILITPEYWFKNLHSQNIRNYILREGYIKEIYYLSENKFFKNVNSSFVIFKIIKKKINPKIQIFKLKDNSSKLSNTFLNIDKNFIKLNINQFKENKKWLLHDQNDLNDCSLIENECKNVNSKDLFGHYDYSKLKDISQIANGLVSGLDKAFVCDDSLFKKLNKLEKKAIVKVVKSFNLQAFKNETFEKYIFLNSKSVKNFKSQYPNFHKHFQKFKNILQKRYNYNRKIKYWDWVFLRSYDLISSKRNKICIPCKLRISNFNDIKFCYVKNEFLLTQDVTSIYLKQNVKESIFYILGFLNSSYIKKWIFINNNNRGNVLEFSETPLNSIPIRLINWNVKKEVNIYNEIVDLTKNIIKKYDLNLLKKLDNEIKSLLNF